MGWQFWLRGKQRQTAKHAFFLSKLDKLFGYSSFPSVAEPSLPNTVSIYPLGYLHSGFPMPATSAHILLCCTVQKAATISTENDALVAFATKQPCLCYLHHPFLPQNAKLDPRLKPRQLENFAKRLGFCYIPFANPLPHWSDFHEQSRRPAVGVDCT